LHCHLDQNRAPIRRPRLISHPPTFFSSDIPNILCREWLCTGFLTTGWRYWNGFLKTMVNSIQH
jgi:hypothetical protein